MKVFASLIQYDKLRYRMPQGTCAGGAYWPLIGPGFKYAIRKLLINGGPSRIRTYDFHRVKVALYR